MSEEIELASPAELAKLQALYLNPTPEPTERAKQLAQIAREYAASEEKRRAARPWKKKAADRLARDKEEDERFEQSWKKFEDPTYYGLQVRRRSKTE